jgi:hypothetical protein
MSLLNTTLNPLAGGRIPATGATPRQFPENESQQKTNNRGGNSDHDWLFQ